MSDTVSIVTRKFGLRPQEPGVKLNLDLFSGFEKAVNCMIRHGIKMEERRFEKDSLTAVKLFHDRIRKLPQVHKKLKFTGLRERARRCAAQPAYFAIQEYKNRGKVVANLVKIILSYRGLFCLLDENFPNDQILAEARQVIVSTLNGKYGSREYLKNMFLHVRNLVKKMLKNSNIKEIVEPTTNLKVPEELAAEVGKWIIENLENELKKFFRKLSRVLTERVKKIVNNKALAGAGRLDTLVLKIVETQKISRNHWKLKRPKWRNLQFDLLKSQLSALAPRKLAKLAINAVMSDLTPARVVNLLFKTSPKNPRVSGETMADFKQFLLSKAMIRVEGAVAKQLQLKLQAQVQNMLHSLRKIPWKWLKKPHFQGQAVPLGIDDGQVYNLDYNETAKNGPVGVRLSFFPHQIVHYTIHEPSRFYKMLEKGLKPKRGVLLKKPGGSLVLCMPFIAEKEEGAKVFDIMSPPTSHYIVTGVDLGLKIFATLSTDQCRLTANGTWEKVDNNKGDIARHFIDQRQLFGKRNDWYLPSHTSQIINFKQKLVRLQKHSRRLQSKLKLYSAKYLESYSHKLKFWKLKREWKRAWQKIQNIHEELARQLATRIVAIAKQLETNVLRLEDLSWTKHAAKNKAGYFLTTWQVHWFHAKITELVCQMAARAGIHVELVNPRDTSNRCSRCGKIGNRTGKVFKCASCGFELDSDLNAARNITVAPNSPTAIRDRGRCPLPPTN